MKIDAPNDELDLIPTRQSLLSRLKDCEDNKSWRDFFEIYWRLIYRTAIKAQLTEAEAQDVVQETMLAVVRSIPEFDYRKEHSSFKSWLLRLTHWRVQDQFRKRRLPGQPEGRKRRAGVATRTSTVERIADPASLNLEATWDQDWEANLMEVALERVKKEIDPASYQIFDFYVLKNWPASRVAKALNISQGRVYVAKYRITNLVKKEVARLKTDPVFERWHEKESRTPK